MKTSKNKPAGELDRCLNSRLHAWATGYPRVPELPYQLYINPANICNNRCVMCPHERVMRPERGVMPMELFKKIADQIPDTVRRVYLLKQGEPFLNPELPAMMAYLKAKKPGVYLCVHTNTTVPMKNVMRTILRTADAIGFSVSAISRGTYAQVHGCDQFERVMANLEHAHSVLSELPVADRPHVFIDYVRQELNNDETVGEVCQFYDSRFPEFGSVDFHSMFNWQGDIQGKDIASLIPPAMFPCCVFPWSTMTICHDGKVSYCQEEAKENLFLGDINQTRLEDIWNNDAYCRFREMMQKRQYTQLLDNGFFCRQCSYLWNFHSQSPQNLAQGFFKHRDNLSNLKFGNLLAVSAEKMLAYAREYYLAGEIHSALGCLSHLKTVDCPDPLKEDVNKLEGICLRMLEQYAHMYEIKEILKQNHAEILPNVYHGLGS